MKVVRPFNLVSTGKYVPKSISSSELELRFGLPKGWSEKYSGVKSRHWATTETNAFMGARALEQALEKSGLSLDHVDLLISANASFDYPIPHQSSLIKHELGCDTKLTFPTMDVDATCLSFVSALDVASRYLDGSQYSTIAIVSTEISHNALSTDNREVLTLFGDGAAAAILQFDPSGKRGLIKAAQETHAEGVFDSVIRGGGNVHFFKDFPYDEKLHSFAMNGRKLLRRAKETVPPFVDSFFGELSISITEIPVIIPHQASKIGLELLKAMYNFAPGQVKTNLETHGNCISSSIPMLLHDTIENGELKRGEDCLLIGTAAGFSVGAALFRY